jgi:hypothetical protein
MVRRRLVSAIVLLPWSSSSALAVLHEAGADPHQGCAGHACECQRRSHCPAKRPAAGDCHGKPVDPRPCEMSSRCSHDGDSAPAAPHRDTILTPEVSLGSALGSQPRVASASAEAEAGHPRLDPEPPKSAS